MGATPYKRDISEVVLADPVALGIVQDHIAELRREVASNVSAQTSLFQAMVLGLAAIIALQDKVTLDDILGYAFLLPILLMAIGALVLANNSVLFRLSFFLAVHEQRLNAIAGQPLITYERDLWRWRSKYFARLLPCAKSHGQAARHIGFWVSLAYWGAVFSLALQNDSLKAPVAIVVVGSLALIAYVAALAFYARFLDELRNGASWVKPSTEEPRSI